MLHSRGEFYALSHPRHMTGNVSCLYRDGYWNKREQLLEQDS